MYNNGGGGYDQYDAHQGNHSRVKVEDALSYLDQVKTQFATEPHVYTQFLDIMKDFKSQAIDTPGVITRVSSLFHGKPQLILGFNQFLPQGFQVSIDGNNITILEPDGRRRRIEDGNVVDTPADEMQDVEDQLMDEAMEPEAESGDEGSSSGGHDDSSFTDGGIDHRGSQLNTAIGYVNKIKARFATRPYVYKKFLDILQEYQRGLDETSMSQSATERAILDAVEELFGEETDLMEEFRYFLPDVHGLHQRPPPVREVKTEEPDSDQEEEMESDIDQEVEEPTTEGASEGEEEEDADMTEEPDVEPETSGEEEDEYDAKEYPIHHQISDLDDFITSVRIEDFAFFEKVRRTASEEELETFFRALNLYNMNIISAQELLAILQPVLGGYPNILNELNRRFLARDISSSSSALDDLTPEEQHQIDYASCKQLGVSYRSLPENVQPPVCSGRTALCRSVLNDTWVSFPSWSSEDTTVVSSKKTQYEDFVCRTEDERFELDIIIEVNKYAVDSLEFVRRKMNRMSTLEQEKFRLDEKLGASSSTLMSRAIRRIYGEHAGKVIDGLRKNPLVTVPKVIERLKDKEREWREAQEQMNKIWREQNDKHMIRALDHQSNALKTSDAKWIKAKQIITQMEQLFDERQQKSEEGSCEDAGPHMILSYPPDKNIIHEATDLILHFVKRQANINGDEKKKIKRVLRKYVNEWFFLEQEAMSDDEENHINGQRAFDDDFDDYKEPVHMMGSARCRLLYGGNPLLVFLRVHHILCDRLWKVKRKYLDMVSEYKFDEAISKRRTELYNEHGKGAGSHELNASDMNNGLMEMKGVRRCPLSFYADLMADIKLLLDGQLESTAFEDNIRSMFPLDGYLMFTVDKIISVCTRQLQQLATDSDNSEAIKLYDHYKTNPPFSVYDDTDRRNGIEGEYSAAAESKMNCQNCFKIYLIDEEKMKITLELVDTETEEDGDTDNGEIIERAASTAASTDEDDLDDEDCSLRTGLLRRRMRQMQREKKLASGIFLRRNTRWRKRDPNTFDMFIVLKGTYSTAEERERLCHLSHEGIIRKQKIGCHNALQNLARMHTIRRRRFARVKIDDDESETTWLDEGTTRTTVHNPKFPFLIYKRYVFKKE